MLGVGFSSFQLAVRRLLGAVLPPSPVPWSDTAVWNDNLIWSDAA